MKTMKAQEEQNIILNESTESNTPVTHIKALGKQTKPISASTQTKLVTSSNRTQTDRQSYKNTGNQAWKTNLISGGVPTDSKSSNDDGTQTSVADGAGYYNLMDDAIMEEVEVENAKRSKKQIIY